MSQPSKIVRFGFSLIAVLMVVGLIYAGTETPESELAAIIARLGAKLNG
ncbi:MAG: hypothetical protein AB8G18_18590 [Gammaproteobacteria bacterium]